MTHSILSIAEIEREARRAADRGESCEHACRYPFDTDAGRAFVRAHVFHTEARKQLRLEPTTKAHP